MNNLDSKSITRPLECYDDLKVIGKDLSDCPKRGVTLCSRIKNERYYIRPFFNHYRNLGVGRFVIIDDDSTDGTREYLLDQPDCMVLNSEYTYMGGYPIASASETGPVVSGVKNIWLNLLLRKFATNRWAIYADADEFLRLPDGFDINDIVQVLNNKNENVAWTLMLDVYPDSISKLLAETEDDELDRENDWYFDGIRHLSFAKKKITYDGTVRKTDRPKVIYGGSRARLMRDYGVGKINKSNFRNNVRKLIGKVPRYNNIIKTMLIKVPENGYLIDPHTPYFDVKSETILPVEHYKFCGDILRRSKNAVSTKSHYKNSIEYVDMLELLSRMQHPNLLESVFNGPKIGNFRNENSRRSSLFKNYVDTGNVGGIPIIC